MTKKSVGVVRGGVSKEYDVSLRSGDTVLSSISRDSYDPLDILITKDGEWNMNGYPTSPDKAAKHVDVFFNALHGEYGEDGKVQQLFEVHGVPYTGSGVIPSAVALNKGLTKHALELSGLKTPRSVTVRAGEDMSERAYDVFRSLSAPYVAKPISGGSSIDVVLVRSFDDLVLVLYDMTSRYTAVLVEEYIVGREIACGVIDSVGKDDVYPTYPVEIVLPPGEDVWTYDTKYERGALRVCPANIDAGRASTIQALAVQVHKALGLRHYSFTDFIVSPRGMYIIEVNSLPGLTTTSLLPTALKAAGVTMSEFIEHVLTLALRSR